MIAFFEWWQGLPYRIDPVIFHVVGVPIRYYGLAYVLAFVVTYVLVNYRIRNEVRFSEYDKYLQDLMAFIILGVFVGGRLGYAVFYAFDYYVQKPFEVVLPFDISNGYVFTGFSGMSYHGGLIGSVLAVFLFTNFHNGKIGFLKTADLFVPAVPLGYTFGRLGNFMNGELYGRPTSLPIGMYFPDDGTNILRHPSQLYEAFFEGIVLFAVLWVLKNRNFERGFMLPIYLVGYGVVRFFIEYLRQPDFHIKVIFAYFSMGQILCVAMILVGLFMLLVFSKVRPCFLNSGS